MDGRTFSFLLDTGCEKSLLPASFVKGYDLQPLSCRVVAANGTVIPMLGMTTVHLQLGQTSIPVEVMVSEFVSEGMLGSDWLESQHFVWDFEHKCLAKDGVSYPLKSRERSHRCSRIMVNEPMLIPARHEAVVRGRLEVASMGDLDGPLMAESRVLGSGV